MLKIPSLLYLLHKYVFPIHERCYLSYQLNLNDNDDGDDEEFHRVTGIISQLIVINDSARRRNGEKKC